MFLGNNESVLHTENCNLIFKIIQIIFNHILIWSTNCHKYVSVLNCHSEGYGSNILKVKMLKKNPKKSNI